MGHSRWDVTYWAHASSFRSALPDHPGRSSEACHLPVLNQKDTLRAFSLHSLSALV